MKKFEKVKRCLEAKTMTEGEWLTVTTNVDTRHTGKYAIKNLITNNVHPISYKTLDEIIKEFGLEKIIEKF